MGVFQRQIGKWITALDKRYLPCISFFQFLTYLYLGKSIRSGSRGFVKLSSRVEGSRAICNSSTLMLLHVTDLSLRVVNNNRYQEAGSKKHRCIKTTPDQISPIHASHNRLGNTLKPSISVDGSNHAGHSPYTAQDAVDLCSLSGQRTQEKASKEPPNGFNVVQVKNARYIL